MQFNKALHFAIKRYDEILDKHVAEFIKEIVHPRAMQWVTRIMQEAEHAKYSDFYGGLKGSEQNKLKHLFIQADIPRLLERIFGIDQSHSIITDLPHLHDLFETVYRDIADIWADVFMTHIGQYDLRYTIDDAEIEDAYRKLIDGRTTEEYFTAVIKRAADRTSASLLAILIRAKSASDARAGARMFVNSHAAQLEREMMLGVEHKLIQARNEAISSMTQALASGVNVQFDRLEAVNG